MKRKTICLLLCALLTASLFGCNGGDVSVAFTEVKPWEYAGYEKCTYEIKRIYTAGGGETTVATGTYVTELSTVGDETTVHNTFTLTYNDDAHADTTDLSGKTVRNKNMTDAYVSSAVFKRDSLVPVKTATKSFAIAQRKLNDGEMTREDNPQEGISYRYAMHTTDVYGDPRGYEYEINYDTNESTYKTTVGNTVQIDGAYYRNYTEDVKSYTVGSGTRFDNEQLPYLVRALSNLKTKGTATFYLTNMADSYLQNAYVRHTMGLSCADKTTSFTLSAPGGYILRNKEGELNKSELGEYSVPCIKASVGLNSSKPGPDIQMLISDPSIFFVRSQAYESDPAGSDQALQATNRVILQMTYTEYALSAARVAYKTVYTLKDYTTKR
ncbi:MAG: hypothetical protein K2M95_05895 [Clostridiales bacterium]|nr:hypothetical protein [Clostridiales bacterium]